MDRVSFSRTKPVDTEQMCVYSLLRDDYGGDQPERVDDLAE